jgi:hypothetical protein
MTIFSHRYLARNIWAVPNASGPAPSPRHSHASIVIGTKIYIYGGSNGTQVFDDVYSFDTATNTWEKVNPEGTVAPGRTRTDIALWKNELLVFGGQGNSGNLADLWGFDIGNYSKIN